MTMKTWIVVLIVAAIGLLVFLWRRRERFSAGSIQPTCPEGLSLVGKKCRGEGGDNLTGECPGGMTMNEEGMCQRLEDPTCPAEYTLAYDDFTAMCESNTPIQEPSDEEMYARQQAAEAVQAQYQADNFATPICPAGTTADQWNRCRYPDEEPSTQCPAGHRYINRFCESSSNPPEYVSPICPEGKVYERSLAACIRPYVAPTCPSGYNLEGSTTTRFDCKKIIPQETPAVPPPTPPTAPPTAPPIAPPPVVTPKMIAPPPTPRELVFQPKLLGTPGGVVIPADTRIGELIGGLFSPIEQRQEPSPSEYTL